MSTLALDLADKHDFSHVIDRSGRRWYTVLELAQLLGVSRVTVRRALRPHRQECRLTRDRRHPRRILVMPDTVAKAIEEYLR